MDGRWVGEEPDDDLVEVRMMYGSVERQARTMLCAQLTATTLLMKNGADGPRGHSADRVRLQRSFRVSDIRAHLDLGNDGSAAHSWCRV
jgi:hypothetical protein